MFKDIKVEEILVYLMLIIVGYYIAKMFSRSCNGFRVGGQETLPCHILNDTPLHNCTSGKIPLSQSDMENTHATGNTFQDICCQ